MQQCGQEQYAVAHRGNKVLRRSAPAPRAVIAALCLWQAHNGLGQDRLQVWVRRRDTGQVGVVQARKKREHLLQPRHRGACTH